MDFQVPSTREFVVDNDVGFTVRSSNKFYRPRENVWLKREFALNVFVHDTAGRYLPRSSVNPVMDRLTPDRTMERIHAAW